MQTRPSVPAHRHVQSVLEDRIAGGRWPVGTRLAPEPELAAELGVSRGTLRRALAGMRQQGLIEGVPGRGSRVVSASPARSGVRRIAVLLPSLAKPYIGTIVQAVEDELHGEGYSVLFGSSGVSREQEAGRVRRMLEDGVAGFIAYPIDYRPSRELYAELSARGLPVVLIDRYLPSIALDAVVADNLGGAYQAVAHLLELGHRRIAFIATDNVSTTSVAERLQGYRQALQAAGLEPDDRLVSSRLPVAAIGWATSAKQKAEVRKSIGDFLEETAPTAVFALHDRLAFEVSQAAAALGLAVPGDLSVVGFDDDLVAQNLMPGLTSVRQPRERMGRLAVRLLLRRIEGSREEPVRHSLATTLIPRQSTASPRPAEAARPI